MRTAIGVHLLADTRPAHPLVFAALLAACSTPAAAPKPGPADELAWLIGRWQFADNPAITEERWVRAPDGDLIGSSRVLVEGMLGFSETLNITRQGDQLVYLAWPSGQDPVVFQRASGGATSVVFENPAHDFPSRISYTLNGDKLEAKASGNKPSGPAEESWTLQRMPDRPVPGAQPAAGTVDGPK